VKTRDYVSANPNARLGENRLIYYVIVSGKGKRQVAYHYVIEHPEKWLIGGNYKNVLAVQHKGVNFSVYDYPPFESNAMYALLFDDVLGREGLIE